MRDQYIRIRLTKEEREVLEYVSSSKGLGISKLVRELIAKDFKDIKKYQEKKAKEV